MEDGAFVLARLPYPSTSPRRLAVASEVATMDLVRSHGILTPRVLDYSIEDNSVGSEYIIMEKLLGRPIGDAWFDLSEQERLQVLHDIVQLEAKMFNMKLPANGSIYYARDLPSDTHRIVIPGTNDHFCVGPSASRWWWFGTRESLEVDRGPRKYDYSHQISERSRVVDTDAIRALEAPAEKELAWIRKFGRPRYPYHRQHREAFQYEKQDPKEHIKSLENYLQLVQHLVPTTLELSLPVLRHPDLQPNNIFVGDDYKVTTLIDWQHAVVLPTFLAAGIPNFLQNYNDPESRYFVPPHLSSDIEELEPGKRAEVQEAFRRRHIHFFYLCLPQRLNSDNWCALTEPADILRRRMFDHASESWEGLNTPLQYDHVQISQHWNQVASPSSNGAQVSCPVSLSKEESERIDALDDSHRDADLDVENINNMLDVASDGWTTNDRYDSAKAKAAEIKEQALASANDDPWLREMSERHWPWDDYDGEE
jgi:hypothetical protein